MTLLLTSPSSISILLAGLNQACNQVEFQPLSRGEIPSAVRLASDVVQANRAADDELDKAIVLHSQAIVDVGDDLFQHSPVTSQRAFGVHVAQLASSVNQQSGVASEPTPIGGKARHNRYCRRGDERLPRNHMSRP